MIPAAVLFDVFGTLVAYNPDRSRLTYPATYRMAVAHGYGGTHDEFVEAWDEASKELEVRAEHTRVEFSMTDAAEAFAHRIGFSVDRRGATALGTSFVEEWQVHVVPVPGAAGMLRRIAETVRVGVVSNTHDPAMVPNMLRAMGVADVVEVVVLSVVHGRRKPDPGIYDEALRRLGVAATDTWFVGDTYEPDYRAPRELGMRGLLIGGDPSLPVDTADRLSVVTDVEHVLGETLSHPSG